MLGRAAAELDDVIYSEEDFPVLAAEVEAAARSDLGDGGFSTAFQAGRNAEG